MDGIIRNDPEVLVDETAPQGPSLLSGPRTLLYRRVPEADEASVTSKIIGSSGTLPEAFSAGRSDGG